MNQILQINNFGKGNKSSSLKDLIVFLVIFMLIFGTIIVAYSIYQKIVEGNGNADVIPELPVITMGVIDNKLTLNVESKVGLSKILYRINGQEEEISLEGALNIEKTIELPIGENTVYVLATDINEVENIKEENYLVEGQRPKIELSVIGNNIKISVISTIELKEITYTWNDETPKKENMATYENRTEFEKQIQIPVGTNTLKIVATDVEGGVAEKTQEIKAIVKAEATTEVRGEYWCFTVEAKENIEKVEFEFNGKKYIMNTDTFGQTKRVFYKVKLVEGINYLTITSTTQSGGTDTTNYEQEYTK